MGATVADRRRPPKREGSLLSIASRADAEHATPLRPGELGRAMSVEDIQAILPQVNGKPRTRWYVNHSFLPEKKQKDGRVSFWWERDVFEHLYGRAVTVAPIAARVE